MKIFNRLFPKADTEIRIPHIPVYFLGFVALVSTVRSLIHIFTQDGGAQSIAGIDVQVQGGANIVALFAQWGVVQLLLALMYWLVILRYRFLTPAMLLVVVLEQAFRMGAGLLKPLEIAAPPPGEIGSYVVLPLALIALLIALFRKENQQ